MGKTKIIVGIALLSITVLAFMLKYQTGRAENKPIVSERPPVTVETVTVAPDSIIESVDVVGTLSPKFQTDVKTEYPGVVREVYVTEWVRVKKGEKLLSLDTREPEAVLNKVKSALEMGQANLMEAKAAAQRADREFNRIVKLQESGLSTQQSVDEAATQKEVALARLSSVQAMVNSASRDYDQAKLRFSKMVLYSPIDGIVSERKVSVGDLTSDKPLFKLVDIRVLDLTVTVPSKFIRFLKTGLTLQFTTDAFPDQTFNGVVKYINPTLNEADRSVRVVAEVQNPSEILKGGLFVQGKIIIDERKNVLQVPRNALVNWDLNTKKASLFIVDNGAAKTRDVIVGVTTGDMVEITSGIAAGDQVICRGGFNIKDGDKIRLNGGK